MTCLAFLGKQRHRTSSSHATANRPAYLSGSSRRTTGSTTDLNTTHGFCSVSSRLALASARAEVSSSKTSNNGALQTIHKQHRATEVSHGGLANDILNLFAFGTLVPAAVYTGAAL